MAFKDIFKDKNEFNEKTIIGFMSFAVMTLYSITDLVTESFRLKSTTPSFKMKLLLNTIDRYVFVEFFPLVKNPLVCSFVFFMMIPSFST